MKPKNRISCVGLWAITHDNQKGVGEVVEFLSDANGFYYKSGSTNISSEDLKNLTAWCLIDKTGYVVHPF